MKKFLLSLLLSLGLLAPSAQLYAREALPAGCDGHEDDLAQLVHHRDDPKAEWYLEVISSPMKNRPETTLDAYSRVAVNPMLREVADLDEKTLLQPIYNPRSAPKKIQTRPAHDPKVRGAAYGGIRHEDYLKNPDDYVVLYHGTNRDGESAILGHGVDLNRGQGEFGPGFYLTSSPSQAKTWAEARYKEFSDRQRAGKQPPGDGRPSVLRVIIKKSELEEIYKRGNYLSFPLNSAQTGDHVFHNFVEANQALRKQVEIQNRMAAENKKKGATPPPAKSAPAQDLNSGPSISADRQNVFDQHKFSPTASNLKLFSRDSPHILIEPVDVQ